MGALSKCVRKMNKNHICKNLIDKLDHEKLSAVVRSSKLQFWELDLVRQEIRCPENALEKIGYPPDKILSVKEFQALVHPEDLGAVTDGIFELIKNNKTYAVDYRIVRPSDGKVYWAHATAIPVFDDDGMLISLIGTSYEITDVKEAELRAEMAGRAKSQFLANMSHEIRTPMNGILGMTELLNNSDLQPKQQDFVDIIQRSGNALLTIINDILDFSKIEAAKLSLLSEPFVLRDSVEDVTSLLASGVSDSGVDLLLRIQPDLPKTFLGDVGRVRQILTNIIGNAVKFTHEGHVLVDISGVCEEGVCALRFTVSDTGVGIPQDKVTKIFDKFNQADVSTTREFGGTGLGLNIARELVRLMGGDIIVESDVGKGSQFTFNIALPVHTDTVVETPSLRDIAGAKILIIDDNKDNRDILTEQLDYWGCRVMAVESAAQGIRVLERGELKNIVFDLIIVDYQMPVSSGESFVRSLKARDTFKDIPIIMLSSVDKSELQKVMFDLGVKAFLTKPSRATVLRQEISDAIFSPGKSAEVSGFSVKKLCNYKDIKEEGQVNETSGVFTPGQNLIDASGVAEVSAPDKASVNVNPKMPELSPIMNPHVDVLIAEDNEVNQMYASYVMEELGLSFEIAPNGRVAIEKWEHLSPKIVLMDVSMPDLNGYDATARIRELENISGRSKTPIIAVTAHSIKGDERTCLEKGMDGYLSKPIAVKGLQQCLEQWSVLPNIQNAVG